MIRSLRAVSVRCMPSAYGASKPCPDFSSFVIGCLRDYN